MGLRFNRPMAGGLNIAKLNNNGRSTDYDGYAVTASDSTDLPNGPTSAIYVTGAGNVNVNLVGGGTAVLTSLVAGQILDVAVSRILTTSTTASGIFALYNVV